MSTIQWHTPEYIYTEKTADWYWIVGIIAISLALIAIILNNVIFAILILVGSFTLALFASRPPQVIEVELRPDGIKVGSRMYPYSNLESFWVETEEVYPKIILKSKKIFMPFIIVLIEEVEPEKIRDFLREHLHEERHVEPFLEKLLVYFGF